MKALFPLALAACAAILISACGGTKTAPASTSAGEFDPATGSWKPLTRNVAPPPPQGGAVIVEEKKPGMMNKIGKTVKAPLKWVGLAKDEAPAATTTPAPAAAKKTAE